MMTGPYHTICSLADVLPKHEVFRAAVEKNKQVFLQRMQRYLTLPIQHQPLLCTHVSCSISSQNHRAVLYVPRNTSGGSVVCHLGEVHLGQDARGDILNTLICE
jgi:2-aminoethylphosphonate-pyruvate transaminase